MKPLEGLKVLVTRPEGQAQALVDELKIMGAIPILMPSIRILPVAPNSPLDEALENLARYDWMVFTSVNGVQAVADRVSELPRSLKVAGIGPATCALIERRFRKPDAMPKEYISDAIAPVLGHVNGQRILLARANIARRDLAQDLVSRGAIVDEISAYQIVDAEAVVPQEKPDIITVTSSSAAKAAFNHLVNANKGDWAKELPWASIGPITSKTVKDLGCDVAVTAEEYTIPGLVAALVEYKKKVRISA